VNENPVNGNPGLLTVREVADALRVSKMTIYRLVHSDELASMRVGKHSIRILKTSVQEYLVARADAQ
jgi:excisionase family DNA binding protein